MVLIAQTPRTLTARVLNVGIDDAGPDRSGSFNKRVRIPMVAAVAGLFLRLHTASHATPGNADTLRGSSMRGLKTLISSAALLAGLAMAPTAQGQISVNIGIQPICSYGYYDYQPYACAPMGYYGTGYFYNGIFLGMGPWAGWGYSHGWGSHRFVNDGGGRYHGGGGAAASRGNQGGGQVRGGGNGSGSHARPAAAATRPNAARTTAHAPAAHATASHAPASHAAASHGGEASHGGKDAGGEHK